MKFSCSFRNCTLPARYQYNQITQTNWTTRVTLTFRCEKHRKKPRQKREDSRTKEKGAQG